MYSNNGTNGIIPSIPCSANGPNAMLYPSQLQFSIGIWSTYSNANNTYAVRIPNAIGAYFIEEIPIFRSLIRFFVSLINKRLAPTVKI